MKISNRITIIITTMLLALLLFGMVMGTATEPANPANIRPNVITSFNPTTEKPVIAEETYIDPMASVIGNVKIESKVYVAPFASIRGDEGQPIHVGEGSNVQDGVVVHALETEEKGETIEKNLVKYGGKKYAVYIGKNVSLAHQAQIHGPALVDDNTFIGMQALVFKAWVGKNCVVEPGARLLNSIKVPDGRYVPAGTVVTSQEQADKLPIINDTYPLKDLNKGILHVNEQLAEGYLKIQEVAPAGATVTTAARTEKTPGFEVALAIATLLAVYIYGRKRR